MEKELMEFLDRAADFCSSSQSETSREQLWLAFSGKEKAKQDDFPEMAEEVYRLLLEEGFGENAYLKAAAVYIASEKNKETFGLSVHKMKLLYRHIQNIGKTETGEAYCGAALLAASGISVPEYQQRTKRIYELLGNWMSERTGLRKSIVPVLLFHTDVIALCERAIRLQRAFSAAGTPHPGDCSLLLGFLALSKDTPEQTAVKVTAAADYLKKKNCILSEGQEMIFATAACAYLVTEYRKGDKGSLSQVALQSMKGDFAAAAAEAWICCF